MLIHFIVMVDWDLVGFVLASRHRRSILKFLQSGPSTPKQISEGLTLHMSQTSQLLNNLYMKNLVICLNPTAKRGRIYDVTPFGREIIEFIKEIH